MAVRIPKINHPRPSLTIGGGSFGTAEPVSIQGLSFWQQDRNYWNRSQTRSQSLANSDALISVMGSAMTNLASGLASIANQQALNRVNTQITAAVQSALQAASGGSTSSSGNSSAGNSSASSAPSASSSGSSNPTFVPATGTGTVPLSASTPLPTLRIPPNGTITVSDGTNTTTYTSTGTDTVTDLISALNTNVFGNAQVTASLNSKGNLVIAGKFNTETVTVGGTFAPAIGFDLGNNTFQPTLAANGSNSSGTSSSSSSSAASSAGGSSNSTASSAGTSTGSSSGIPNNSAYALQTGGTAEILLASNGLAGTLLNVLA
jgi:trimeric autotransporter adhesin